MLCCDTMRGRHSHCLAYLLGLLTFACIACLLQLWIKTSKLNYSRCPRKELWDKGLSLNLHTLPHAAFEDYKETKKNDSLFWSRGTVITFSRSIVWTEYSEYIFKKCFLVIWGIWRILWSAFGKQIWMSYLSFGAARTGTDYLRTQIL